MKIYYLILFFLFQSISLLAQSKANEILIEDLNIEQRKMFELLRECIDKKIMDKKSFHLFSKCSYFENNEKVEISIKYYDLPYKYDGYYTVSSASYQAFLTFEKWKEIGVTSVTDKNSYSNESKFDRETKTIKPDYSINIKDLSLNKRDFDRNPHILYKKSEIPYFNQEFKNITFQYNKIQKAIDEKIYDAQERSSFVGKEFIVISKNNKYGVLTSSGVELIPFEYDYIWFLGKNFIVKKDNKTFIIDSNNARISEVYDYFSSDMEYGNYLSYFPFLKNLIKVKRNDKVTFLDIETLKEVFPLKYKELIPFSKELISFLGTVNDKQVIIDFKEFKEISKQYDKILKIDDEFLQVSLNEKIGILNSSLKEILPVQYDSLVFMGRNYAKGNTYVAMKKNNKYKIYLNFNLITNQEFDEFKEETGFIIVRKNDKFGTIDLKGNILIEIKYEAIELNKSKRIYEAKIGDSIFKINHKGLID